MSNTATPEAAVGTFDYLLPSLGADMDEGRVIEWRVAIGDTVHRGDLMAVVETEKSDIDIEIWHDGTVEAFLVSIGELIPVGTPIVRLRGSGGGSEPIVARPAPAAAPTTTPAAPAPARPRTPLPPPARNGDRVLASPLARRLGAERGLDLATITGTGPGGAVVEADVRRAPVEPPPNRRVGAHRRPCARSSPNG